MSDTIAELTRVKDLELHSNAFSVFPAAILVMTQLTFLGVSQSLGFCLLLNALVQLHSNRLAVIPPEIGSLWALTTLRVSHQHRRVSPRLISTAGLQCNRCSAARDRTFASPGTLRRALLANAFVAPALTAQTQLNNNSLASLPSELGLLPKLSAVYVRDTVFFFFPFHSPPHSSTTTD